MNALDNMLNGDEPIVAQIYQEMGEAAANSFINEHNNFCMQFARFEDILMYVVATRAVFVAPPTNLSFSEEN